MTASPIDSIDNIDNIDNIDSAGVYTKSYQQPR
jgi:hypothetical protein